MKNRFTTFLSIALLLVFIGGGCVSNAPTDEKLEIKEMYFPTPQYD